MTAPGDTTAPAIWVTGPDRSGTTLMYSLLASHPNISMVRRTNMWRWFYRSFGDLDQPEHLARALDVMCSYQRMEVLSPDPARIRADFRRGAPTYGRLFALFHEHHAERRGRSRWGDKSLHHEHHAAEILSEFPNARIIHMLRDPRDRHASVTRRYEGRSKGTGSVIGRWISSTVAGERNQRRFPDRYLMVKFEDLAASPEPTMRGVCKFIGEDYTAAMLDMGGDAAPDEGNSSFEPLPRRAISTQPIGRYRSVLSPRDIAEIQTLTGPWMKRHAYSKDAVHLPGGMRLSLRAVEMPEAALRVGGWIVADALRRRRGETVPERRLVGQGELT